jgi:hypothetical protein
MTHDVDDDDLRTAMHDAVSDVGPRDGLDRIRSRTKTSKAAPTRWLPLATAAAAAVVLVIGGTAWVAQVTSSDDTGSGPGQRGDTTGTADTPSRSLTLPVAFVGATASGPRLFTEYHEVADTTATTLQAGVSLALSAQPDDPDYTNYLRDRGVTAQAQEAGGALVIDLSTSLRGRPSGMSAATAAMVVQGLVWTADTAASAGHAPVTFTVDGDPTGDVLGVDTREPIAPGSDDSVLSPISIDTPTQGARLFGTFEVSGMAATTEANVVWELKEGGRVVQHGFTTAAQCCTLSPYNFTISAPPGDYTVVVHDTDESNGEGVGTSQDTKTISVH